MNIVKKNGPRTYIDFLHLETILINCSLLTQIKDSIIEQIHDFFFFKPTGYLHDSFTKFKCRKERDSDTAVFLDLLSATSVGELTLFAFRNIHVPIMGILNITGSNKDVKTVFFILVIFGKLLKFMFKTGEE